jgi:hypothetical protein
MEGLLEAVILTNAAHFSKTYYTYRTPGIWANVASISERGKAVKISLLIVTEIKNGNGMMTLELFTKIRQSTPSHSRYETGTTFSS